VTRPGIYSEPHFRVYRFAEMCLKGMIQSEFTKCDEITVEKNEKYALDFYFNKSNDENSLYSPSPLPHAWSLDFLALPPSIAIRKPSYFCRAALAMTRHLPPTEEFRLAKQEIERI
jgi:hypothetical protein